MCAFSTTIAKNTRNIENDITQNAKIVDIFSLNFWIRSGQKVYKFCGSRQELSNEYLLAKIGFGTAEKGPLKASVQPSFEGSLKVYTEYKPKVRKT